MDLCSSLTCPADIPRTPRRELRAKFAGNQDHLHDDAAQMTSVWLRTVHQMGCSGARWLGRTTLASAFLIWLQYTQPGQTSYQQKRLGPYISAAHPNGRCRTAFPCLVPAAGLRQPRNTLKYRLVLLLETRLRQDRCGRERGT